MLSQSEHDKSHCTKQDGYASRSVHCSSMSRRGSLPWCASPTTSVLHRNCFATHGFRRSDGSSYARDAPLVPPVIQRWANASKSFRGVNACPTSARQRPAVFRRAFQKPTKVTVHIRQFLIRPAQMPKTIGFSG